MKKIFCKKHKTICHPGGFTLCRENVTKCHIFERWRRVNECEPSPVSEQIEHTKTECLYAKLCERKVNPRQRICLLLPLTGIKIIETSKMASPQLNSKRRQPVMTLKQNKVFNFKQFFEFSCFQNCFNSFQNF